MICRIVLAVFALGYAASLGLLAIGTFGLFGAERDPLAGVYVIVLGLPWVRFAGMAPAAAGPFLAALAPALNLALIAVLCGLARRRSAP